ncbi:MAG: PAS domain S-box protein, partial [Acidimicrobiia bacterium]|nr:PAS domain S-box protein [Acidimicrobiia bacterium]
MAMRIGELARRTGIAAGTLRAWERRFGLLSPVRSGGGQRRYQEADVERVLVVRRLIGEGLTLAAAVDRVHGAGGSALPSEAESLLLAQIVQNLDQGILVARDARLRYANSRAAEMLRCSLDDLLARSLLDFIPEAERHGARERLSQLRLGAVPEPFDQRLRRADGTTLIVEAHVRPLFDRAGRYEGSVAIMTDVTARRAAEKEHRFRAALLDAVGEALMAATEDGTITYMNQAAAALSGWSPEEVVGRHISAFPSAQGAGEQLEEVRERARAGQRFSGEVPMLRKDGSVFPASFTSTPVRSLDGEIVGRIGVIRDLTEERLSRTVTRSSPARNSRVT